MQTERSAILCGVRPPIQSQRDFDPEWQMRLAEAQMEPLRVRISDINRFLAEESSVHHFRSSLMQEISNRAPRATRTKLHRESNTMRYMLQFSCFLCRFKIFRLTQANRFRTLRADAFT